MTVMMHILTGYDNEYRLGAIELILGNSVQNQARPSMRYDVWSNNVDDRFNGSDDQEWMGDIFVKDGLNYVQNIIGL
jgi:hypothetical protein